MSKELVIGSNRHEIKVAVLEDDQLAEIYFQRENEYSLAGSIHKGRVTRVLPGMQSAFVDVGLERDTFLYVSDFFEENEDIDTVTEERPTRADRRERGPNRGGERPVAAEEPDREPGILPGAMAQGQQGVVAEAGLPPSEVSATSEVTPESKQQNDRGENDRNFPGDRRGRRSRRRRSRGRGFPDTKYAQPLTPESQERETGAPTEAGEEDGGEEEAANVIILPGESLAKYRRRSSASETEAGSSGRQAETAIAGAPTSESEPEPALASAEDIESKAQEIELVDKVLSHHDNEPELNEEEKLDQVKQDQPDSPFVVSDIEAEDESAAREEQASPYVASGELQREEQEAPFEVRIATAELLTRSEAGLSAAERAEDEVSESDALDVDDLELEHSHNSIETNMGSPNAPVPAADEQHPQMQSASVREQGGRYLHRVSRRMRRRRGGSRFAPQSHEIGSEAGVSPGSAGMGAAVQPEFRTQPRRETEEQPAAEKPDRVLPSIAELLKPGQEIIVQIAKEPLGQKGARITSHVALPGRYVVFMPSVSHLGVSRKIESDEERQRLKRILQAHRAGATGGFIVRTAGEGVPEDEVAADMDFLYKLWLDIRQKAEKKPAPALLHYDLDIVQRILRDQVTDEFKAIWVDSEDMYENVVSFMQRFQPALVNRVKMYTRSAPIFDAFGITQELEKALRPKVWLKSGGYIVINQTEALVAIDINTGKYVGKSNRLEDTIVKTNTEAVKEIVRQIRLRDLGGIIVVDFIDMDERKNRQKVMQALEDAMRADRAPYKILQFNDFGLVAITRKRVKQSLERTLCSPCPYCEAAGYVKSVQTVVGEILTEAQKIARAIDRKDAMLRVHPEVAKILKGNDNRYLEELEEILGRPVLVKGDPALHHEKFDLG